MKNRKPTMKQKEFVDNLLVNKNITKSALAVYDVKNEDNAHRLGNLTLKSPAVQNYMRSKLKKAGLTENRLSLFIRNIIENGMEAKASVADSLKGIDMALKLLDAYPVKKSEVSTKSLSLHLTDKSPDQLAKMLSTLTQEARGYVKLLKVSKHKG